jgi:hypothetical protein
VCVCVVYMHDTHGMHGPSMCVCVCVLVSASYTHTYILNGEAAGDRPVTPCRYNDTYMHHAYIHTLIHTNILNAEAASYLLQVERYIHTCIHTECRGGWGQASYPFQLEIADSPW